jgi:hypothetical protein
MDHQYRELSQVVRPSLKLKKVYQRSKWLLAIAMSQMGLTYPGQECDFFCPKMVSLNFLARKEFWELSFYLKTLHRQQKVEGRGLGDRKRVQGKEMLG